MQFLVLVLRDRLDPSLVDAGVELMTADKRARHMRFRFERDRRLFLATRLLVRTVLSGYAQVGPGDSRFVADRSGKPHIESPAVTPGLHFNLANTPGLVVCAVSVAHELIGVDVERIDRGADFIGLADRYFSAPEAVALGARAPAERPRRFFEYLDAQGELRKTARLRPGAATRPLHVHHRRRSGSVAFDPRPETTSRAGASR